MELLFKELTSKVIKAYLNVHNTLGYGFLEKVYVNSMCIELKKAGIQFSHQYPIEVYYDQLKVGYYFADIYIENCLIVEVKAMESLREEHEFQLINYLRATNVEVGLLMNFGKKAEFKRKVFENKYKNTSRNSV